MVMPTGDISLICHFCGSDFTLKPKSNLFKNLLIIYLPIQIDTHLLLCPSDLPAANQIRTLTNPRTTYVTRRSVIE